MTDENSSALSARRRGDGGVGVAAILVCAGALNGCNPFAPALDDTLEPISGALGDQRTVLGVFQNIQYSYTYRDTLIYGALLHPEFQFRYFNPDRASDVVFNRDEEVRTTFNLFKGASLLDLQWNDIIGQEGDSLDTDVTRAYTLRIALQANDVLRVEGRATLRLVRTSPTDIWLIRTWRDDSSF